MVVATANPGSLAVRLFVHMRAFADLAELYLDINKLLHQTQAQPGARSNVHMVTEQDDIKGRYMGKEGDAAAQACRDPLQG